MILYHGTDERSLQKILSHGIKPRAQTRRKSVWDEHPSMPDRVYLTVCYAPYFAAVASDGNRGRAVLLEVDWCHLDGALFRSDEDLIMQVTRESSPILDDATLQRAWTHSLNLLGCVAYKGTIPMYAVTRYSLVNLEDNANIALMCLDPTISLMNYKLCSTKYKALTSYLMGDEVDVELLVGGIGDNPGQLSSLLKKQFPDVYKKQIEVLSKKLRIEVHSAVPPSTRC